MSVVKIQVTQQDIDSGKQSNAGDCAIARAITKQLDTRDVTVCATSIMINGKSFKTSNSVASFVSAFDIDKKFVFPMEFLLDFSAPSYKSPTSSSSSCSELVCA